MQASPVVCKYPPLSSSADTFAAMVEDMFPDFVLDASRPAPVDDLPSDPVCVRACVVCVCVCIFACVLVCLCVCICMPARLRVLRFFVVHGRRVRCEAVLLTDFLHTTRTASGAGSDTAPGAAGAADAGGRRLR